MAERTGISWTERTWNPWMGCTKISPGCQNCYMYRDMRQYGRDPTRVQRTSEENWSKLLKWNDEARRNRQQSMVFTCSLSDWFHEDADAWRPEAWQVIRACPNLLFQILTKRPLRIREHLPLDWGDGYPNVWLGVSIENNEHIWRADMLRQIPARTRFISAEPLLGPLPDLDLTGFHWLIVGGESGSGFRPMDHAWARQLRDKAQAAGVAFFFKQSAAMRSGVGDLLDGRQWHEYPAV
jgi:protein gp37